MTYTVLNSVGTVSTTSILLKLIHCILVTELSFAWLIAFFDQATNVCERLLWILKSVSPKPNTKHQLDILSSFPIVFSFSFIHLFNLISIYRVSWCLFVCFCLCLIWQRGWQTWWGVGFWSYLNHSLSIIHFLQTLIFHASNNSILNH